MQLFHDNGLGKVYTAAVLPGTEMKLDGWITNESLAIADVPPVTSRCTLFLLEKMPEDENASLVARLESIPVGGMPPGQ